MITGSSSKNYGITSSKISTITTDDLAMPIYGLEVTFDTKNNRNDFLGDLGTHLRQSADSLSPIKGALTSDRYPTILFFPLGQLGTSKTDVIARMSSSFAFLTLQFGYNFSINTSIHTKTESESEESGSSYLPGYTASSNHTSPSVAPTDEPPTQRSHCCIIS